MNKFSHRLIMLALFLVCSANLRVSAQQPPEQIDVVSLRISHNDMIDSEAKITYRNSAQSLITAYGFIGNVLPNGSYSFGTTLSTISFTNVGNVETGVFIRFRFILTAVESEPIIIRPTVARKKRYFTLGGATVLRGRLEVFDTNPNHYGLIAVDNDFELKGYYKAGLFQNFGVQRTAKLDSLMYELNQTP